LGTSMDVFFGPDLAMSRRNMHYPACIMNDDA
jgi:hypothetical protein